MSPRRILLVANSSWNLSHFRRPLIDAFVKEGFAVEAAVPSGEAPVAGLVTHAIPMVPDGTAPLAELRTLSALVRLMRRIRPHAVLSFTPKGNIYAGLAARVTKTAFVPNVSGLGTGFIRGGLLQRLQTRLYAAAFRTAPTVFFQNADDSALFERLGLVMKRQVRLLPGSGVDCQHFAPVPLPALTPSEASLLFVGRLLGDKGVRELAEAMRLLRPRHPSLSLTLVGEAGAANRTAIMPAEVAGWQAEGLLRHAGEAEDVRPHIAAADAVILPSYREGMPRALLEAAAMGRPLLASNVPGCRSLVRDGENGFLFEARSSESLARAVERFLGLTLAERQAMGDRARCVAEEEYDQRHVVDAYLQTVIALTAKGR